MELLEGEVRALPLIISELQLQVGGHSSGGNSAITSSVKYNRGKTQCFTLNLVPAQNALC